MRREFKMSSSVPVCALVITTTDKHVLSPAHLDAIRKGLASSRDLEAFEFHVETAEHNVSLYYREKDPEGTHDGIHLFSCIVDIEEVRENVSETVDLGQAIYNDFFDQYREFILLN